MKCWEYSKTVQTVEQLSAAAQSNHLELGIPLPKEILGFS